MKEKELIEQLEAENKRPYLVFPIVWMALIPFLPIIIPLAGVLLGFVIYLVQRLLFGETEYQ